MSPARERQLCTGTRCVSEYALLPDEIPPWLPRRVSALDTTSAISRQILREVDERVRREVLTRNILDVREVLDGEDIRHLLLILEHPAKRYVVSSREDFVKDKLPISESEVLLKGNTSHQAVDASIGTRADSATDHAVRMSVIDCVDRIVSATQAGTDPFRSAMFRQEVEVAAVFHGKEQRRRNRAIGFVFLQRRRFCPVMQRGTDSHRTW